MHWEQMRKRCPSSRFVAVAVLPDRTLAFSRRSTKRNCGVADAVSAPGEKVWGVVYEISDTELSNLDRAEGFLCGREQNAYRRCQTQVFADGKAERPLTVWTYFATPEPNPPLPNQEYMRLLLEGAKHWGLPQRYIQKLKQVKVSE
ncbi:MAG: hypothetical protein KatS3mg082_3028 [Nitrospiraceae bacterium]|nr:MAG: hypothetical protein KatS3mg082_3028 [Nitrospiraceae bacterium]